MSNSFIGIGKCQYLFKYLAYSIILKCIKEIITVILDEINYEEPQEYSTSTTKVIKFPEINNHIVMKSIYKYILCILFGLIFNIILKKQNKKKPQKKNKFEKKSHLLLTGVQKIGFNSLIKIIFIGLGMCIYLEIVEILYGMGFYDFDMWPFNILFGLLFMHKFYKLESYSHRLYPLSIVFVVDLCVIFGITFLETNGRTPYTYIEELMGDKTYSIFLFLVFLFNSVLISFSRVYCKKIMETKYISPQLMIFMIGICGLFLSIIIIIISTNVKCEGQPFCNVVDSHNGDAYFDSIIIYFQNLNEYYKNYTVKFFFEILLVTPILSFMEFIKCYIELLIVYYLNPIYFLSSDTIYYSVETLIKYIVNDIKDPSQSNVKRFLLIFFSDVLTSIAYLIYFEVIELRFCNLNENLRESIIKRATDDSLSSLELDNIIDEDDFEED